MKTNTETQCECDAPGQPCMANSDSGFICTLTAGHSGDHVACGSSGCHRMDVWEQRAPVVLRLNLKGCYFDAIKAGTKPTEYRLVSKWKERIEKLDLRVGVDQILLLRGYPKSGDASRELRRVWNGYIVETLNHPHFGPKPVCVLAIDVTRIAP